MPEQPGLFADLEPAPALAGRDEPARLAAEHAAAAALAARLPPALFFGTSSWSFPGWAGIVYSRRRSTAALARDGLAEYARHPLLRAVGIDRGFYAPIPRADLKRYASQLPAGFPCLAKAPEAVTSQVLVDRSGRGAAAVNGDFLSPQRFIDDMIGPFLDAFADHSGPFLLQLPPAPAGLRLSPEDFAERLDRFLEALPAAARYAVELRDPALLTDRYRAVLAGRGAAHVLNYATAMPMPAEQARQVPVGTAPFTVIRLLLRPGSRYQARRDAFAPFDRIQDPDEDMRRQVVDLVGEGLRLGHRVHVLVNNKAEGSAPLTIRALAERLAAG